MTKDAKKVWKVMEKDFGWMQEPTNFHLEYFEDVVKATKQALSLSELIIKKLTYKQRIKWFFENYYETGMEYELLLKTMKNENLDNFKWYDNIIEIPRYMLVKPIINTEKTTL